MILVINNNQFKNNNLYDSYESYKLKLQRPIKHKVNFENTKQIIYYGKKSFFDFEIEYPESFQKDISFFKTHVSNKVIGIKNHNELFNRYACDFLQKLFVNQNMHIIIDEFMDSLPPKVNSKRLFGELYNMSLLFNNHMLNNDCMIVETESTHIVYTENIIIGFHNNMVIIKPLISYDQLSVISAHKCLVRIDQNYCKIFLNNNESSGIGIATSPTFTNIITSKVDHNNIMIKYKYKCLATNHQIKKVEYIFGQKVLLHVWENINSAHTIKYLDADKNYEKMIINCTIPENGKSNGSNGLRYRGKCTQTTTTNGSNRQTEIKFNDEIQFSKENNLIKLDLITPKYKSMENIIGYKLCRNSNGENRIVKLFIPNDAKIVMPIGSDFIKTNFKERASKAIVMDIMLPDANNNISVVPTEKVAYSFVYGDGTEFKYKVGHEVYPDSFDNNEANTCGNGIHFFRDKSSVLDTYACLADIID